MFKRIFVFFILSFSIFAQVPGAFSITRIHYDGGGDWYSDPSSIPNLLDYVSKNTNISTNVIEQRAKIGDDVFYKSTYLYITGHGNISLTDKEVIILREHLLAGAFLHADDNYGMDKSFRREMSKVFPDKSWVELPPNHQIFNNYFTMPNGLPKIHEHDNKRPQALGLFDNDRLIVLYSYESDLGDGWEDIGVHNNPQTIRNSALEMGTNIIIYALNR